MPGTTPEQAAEARELAKQVEEMAKQPGFHERMKAELEEMIRKASAEEKAQWAAENFKECLRHFVRESGEKPYHISKVTTIPPPSLSRFMNGGSLSLENAAVLMEYLGLEIRPKQQPAKS